MTLRGRILALTTGVAATVLALLAVPLAVLLHSTATQNAHDDAINRAQGVADYLSAGSTTSAVMRAYVTRINDRDDAIPVSVTLSDGSTVGADLPSPRSQPRTSTAIDLSGDGQGPRGDGDDEGGDSRYGRLRPTSDAEVSNVDGGQLIQISVASGSGPDAVSQTVSAFISDSTVRSTVVNRLLAFGAAALVVLLAAAAASEWVSRRLVRHLTDAASTADRLGEGDLAARVPDAGPEEVRRVGSALNRLAGRIDDLLMAERETVADLSHRLRTPLTAVRLDVESLPTSEGKSDLEEHVAQLERTLTAVIHAARRSEREGVSPHCDPVALATERFQFWAPLADDQARTITLDVHLNADPPRLVRCADDDLRAALDALLENAVAHTAEGTDLSVVVAAASGRPATVMVDVRDRGPGVPPGAMRRGQSDRGSTGLGLDIARSCAVASGGHLELVDTDGWVGVRLVLGAADTGWAQ